MGKFTYRVFLLLFFALFFLNSFGFVYAQFSNIRFNVSIMDQKTLGVNNQGFGYPPEVVPSVVGQGNNRLYVLPTSWSFLCKSSENILNSSLSNPINFSANQCTLVSKPSTLDFIGSSGQIVRKDPLVVDYSKPWMFTYNGIASLHYINSNNNFTLVGTNINEHSNQRWSDPNGGYYYYQGSVFPEIDVYDCYSGRDDQGLYKHCWESFAGFNSISYTKLSSIDNWNGQTMTNIGPVSWPTNGYKTSNGDKTNDKVYHTTSFADENNMYLFWVNSYPSVPGKNCISAARAPIDLVLDNQGWRKLYNGQYASQSMPLNFNLSQIDSFYSSTTGGADCLFGNNVDRDYMGIWFKVAKVNNLPYYLGVEERGDPLGGWEMGIRISKDMINWTDLKVLSQTDIAPWGAGDYHYPTLYNSTATSNDVVDNLESFYVLGNNADNGASGGLGYQLHSMNLKIQILPPADKASDMVVQYYRKLLGWSAVDINSPGFNTHLNNINQYGCKKVIKDFTNSSAFINGNQANTSNEEYISLLYEGIISRTPDLNGSAFQWWVNQLSDNIMSREQVIDRILLGWEAYDVCEKGKLFSDKIIVVGDIDGDDDVDYGDYTLMVNDYGNTGSLPIPTNLDGDGDVDVFDFNILISNYSLN